MTKYEATTLERFFSSLDSPGVPLGSVTIEPAARPSLNVGHLFVALFQHAGSNWGDVSESRKLRNEQSQTGGFGEIQSTCSFANGPTVFVATTIARPGTSTVVTVDANDVDTFGGCPTCGQNDGFLNIRRSHWFVCHTHRAKWCVGSNLFSGWRTESRFDWQRNSERIRGYREVEPVFE